MTQVKEVEEERKALQVKRDKLLALELPKLAERAALVELDQRIDHLSVRLATLKNYSRGDNDA